MADAAPRPGSTAALRQRRDAYALARSAAMTLDDARGQCEAGLAGQAAGTLAGLIEAVERNPVAQAMLARAQPGLLGEARALQQHAIRAAGEAVTETGSTDWRSDDGLTETRLIYGSNQRGHYFALEVASRGGDTDAPWQGPFPTAELAGQRGQAAQDREYGVPTFSQAQPPAIEQAEAAIAALWGARERAGAAARGADPPQERPGQAPRPGPAPAAA